MPEPVDFIPAGDKPRYLINGEPYDRVTSLIRDGSPSPWLAPWAAKVTAETAVYDRTWMQLFDEESPEAAVDWLKKARTRVRDGAGNLGTAVHKAAEAHIRGLKLEEFAPEAAEALAATRATRLMAAYARDLVDSMFPPPLWEAVEAGCYSDALGYAGTFDGIIRLGPGKVRKGMPDETSQLLLSLGLMPREKHRILVDWKSSGTLGSDYALQLAAYRWADYHVTRDDEGNYLQERNDPEALAPVGLLLHVRPEGWRVVTVRLDREVMQAFRDVVGVARWSRKGSQQVVRRVPLAQSDGPPPRRVS